MKIKEVCEFAGLTDRAVRYYIENGLVFPETGENYAGRRSFDFSEGDAERLRQIAVFRKAGFGIDQIREIFAGTDVRAAVRERIDQINAEREISTVILRSLIDAEWTEELTAAELARVLEAPAKTAGVPQRDSDPPFPRIIRKARRIIAGLCVGVCVMLVLVGFLFFGILDGADWLGRRWSYGNTLLTVVVDGEMLSSDRFELKDMADDPEIVDKDLDYSYGCIFESWYGYTGGTLVLKDGTEIEFGFLNDNNWHNPHVEIEITTEGDTTTVRQTVAYRSDGDIITGAIKETTVPAGTSRISVVMEGLLG